MAKAGPSVEKRPSRTIVVTSCVAVARPFCDRLWVVGSFCATGIAPSGRYSEVLVAISGKIKVVGRVRGVVA